jgi:hypothetical protein
MDEETLVLIPVCSADVGIGARVTLEVPNEGTLTIGRKVAGGSQGITCAFVSGLVPLLFPKVRNVHSMIRLHNVQNFASQRLGVLISAGVSKV